jgi:HEAT repeat protein
MSDGTFQSQFSIARAERGERYRDARDRILTLEPAARREAFSDLEQIAAAASDWQAQLTAEILIGWIADERTFRTCDAFARGELPRPAPLPGFTVSHRAEAIAELGKAATPRVVERLWKTNEYGDETESGALFGALEKLRDTRAVMPMIALIEDRTSSADVKSFAAGVLSVIGDPRGLEPVLRLAQDRDVAPEARIPAIRSLGRFSDRRASTALIGILENEKLPVEERRAAGDGLLNRSDPATRSPIIDVLEKAGDRLMRLTLVQILGRIGTAEDIPRLQELAGKSPQLRADVDDAIEDIQARQPSRPRP